MAYFYGLTIKSNKKVSFLLWSYLPSAPFLSEITSIFNPLEIFATSNIFVQERGVNSGFRISPHKFSLGSQLPTLEVDAIKILPSESTKFPISHALFGVFSFPLFCAPMVTFIKFSVIVTSFE